MPDTKKDALAATICDALTWHQWQCDGAMDHREAVADAIATLLVKEGMNPPVRHNHDPVGVYGNCPACGTVLPPGVADA